MVECKAAKTLHPGMTAPLAALGRSVGGELRRSVVHRRPLRGAGMNVLTPGIEGLDELEFVELLKAEADPISSNFSHPQKRVTRS